MRGWRFRLILLQVASEIAASESVRVLAAQEVINYVTATHLQERLRELVSKLIPLA